MPGHATERVRPIKGISRVGKGGAAERIFEALRDAIVNHVFQPGERLDVRGLAKQFDVSSMPIRNAVQMLASNGLVEIRPRSGTYVARLSAENLRETFEIRRALECLAAEDVIVNIDDREIRRLSQLADRMKSTTSTQDHARINTEFHRMLIGLSRNRKLLEVYDDLNAHIRIGRIHGSEPNWRARLLEEYSEHSEIVVAIKARDIASLQNALKKHIERAQHALIQTLPVTESAAGDK